MYLRRVIFFILPVLFSLCSAPMFAAENTIPSASVDSVTTTTDAHSWWQKATFNLSETWSHSTSQELYIPAITWHNRWTYDKEKTDKYNERPWGAGYGISRLDADGNWHGLYAMAFKDSFNKWEPIAGYGFEKRWRPTQNQDFQLGLGFTAGVTARDNWRYIPIPVLLPLASINYQRFSFQATYIPGTYNNGNVFFAWLRWQL